MPKFSIKLAAALALAGLCLGDVSPAGAQEAEAEAQPEPITEAADLPAPGEDVGSSSAGMSSGIAYNGGYGGGMLPNGGAPIRRGKDWYGYTDNGPWMRPIRRPIYRVPVQYARYWPTSYYTGGYDPALRYSQPLPMVYQPTDTTQLGFYYQRVPQWQPRPGAIPGPPWPPAWHHTIPTRIGTYNGGSSWYGNGYGAGYGSESGYGYGYGDEGGGWSDQQPTPANPPAVIDHGEEANQTPPAPVEIPEGQDS